MGNVGVVSVAIERDGHRYIFVCDSDRLNELPEAVRAMVDNPLVDFDEMDAEVLFASMEEAEHPVCACCGGQLGSDAYSHTEFCGCGENDLCDHLVCEACHGQIAPSDLKHWCGQVHCPFCQHWQTAVIEIPADASEPMLPLECSNCGLMFARPG